MAEAVEGGFFRLVRYSLLFVFVSGFILQCRESWAKYRQGYIGTTISYEAAGQLPLPEISLCLKSASNVGGSDNLTEFMENLRAASSHMLRTFWDANVLLETNSTSLTNLLDEAEATAAGLDFSDLWREFPFFNFGFILCRSYRPPFAGSLGMIGSIVIQMTLQDNQNFVQLSSDGRFYPSNIHAVDAEFLMVPLSDMQMLNVGVFELSVKKKVFYSRSSRPCSDANYDVIKDCFDRYMEKELECNLPWRRNPGDETAFPGVDCVGEGMFERFETLQKGLGSLNDREFFARTGCTPACSANVYDAQQLSATTSEVNQNDDLASYNARLVLYFTQPEVLVEQEVLVTDLLSFLAEVGGYMGLLLGYSLLSISVSAAERARALLIKKK